MKKLKQLSTEMVVAASATLISLCALTVSIIEANFMYENQLQERKYQKISVLPIILLELRTSDNGHNLTITNNGIGPAVFKSFSLNLGKRDFSETKNALLELYGSDSYIKQSYSTLKNVVIPKEKSIPLFTLSKEANLSKLEGLKLYLCYCSIYDECWEHDAESNINHQVNQCPA